MLELAKALPMQSTFDLGEKDGWTVAMRMAGQVGGLTMLDPSIVLLPSRLLEQLGARPLHLIIQSSPVWHIGWAG